LKCLPLKKRGAGAYRIGECRGPDQQKYQQRKQWVAEAGPAGKSGWEEGEGGRNGTPPTGDVLKGKNRGGGDKSRLKFIQIASGRLTEKRRKGGIRRMF